MDIVLGNPDLIRLIYSFGHASHRQHMKKLEKELLWDTKEKTKNLIHNYIKKKVTPYYFRNDEPYTSLSHYIYTIYTKEECIRFIRYSSMCKCCDKHIINRPVIIDNIIYNTKQEKIYNDVDCFCNCQCRHFSRQALRALEIRSHNQDE